jgi:hypothetical protein
MTPATQRFGEAVFNRALTHSGDPDLAGHVGNAVVRNDSRGHRIVKEHKDSTRRQLLTQRPGLRQQGPPRFGRSLHARPAPGGRGHRPALAAGASGTSPPKRPTV